MLFYSYIFLPLYTLVWTLLLPILSLLALSIVKKWRSSLRMKLGFLPKIEKPHPVWFHAVSVGELNALIPVLKRFQGLNIVLSTSTETAQQMAQSKLKKEIAAKEIELIYMPWDHPLIINSALKQIKPSALVIMETEIWPALIHLAAMKKIPIALINARLAKKSFNSYKLIRLVLKHIFASFSLVLAQSPEDSRRFLELGVPQDKLFMTGNIKFAAFPLLSERAAQELRSRLGYAPDDCIFIAASTHPDEEAAILAIFQELKSSQAKLRLILAPRHPERFPIVHSLIQSAALLETLNFSEMREDAFSVKSSSLKAKQAITVNDVLLLDTIGDLMKIFAIADIAFVGGTVTEDVGGHNVLEPASYGIPVLIGPNYFKNTDTVEMMLNARAITVAETLQELKFALKAMLENKAHRIAMGVSAKAIVDKNSHILQETVSKLRKCLETNVA